MDHEFIKIQKEPGIYLCVNYYGIHMLIKNVFRINIHTQDL
jgi:hypothetical protein